MRNPQRATQEVQPPAAGPPPRAHDLAGLFNVLMTLRVLAPDVIRRWVPARLHGLLEALFAIRMREVASRIGFALVPLRLQPVPALVARMEELRLRPDLFGPFLVVSSLCFSGALICLYSLHEATRVPSLRTLDPRHFDQWVARWMLGLVTSSALVPLLFWLLTRMVGFRIQLLQIACICGYSLAPFLPPLAAAFLPFRVLRVASVTVAAGLSLVHLLGHVSLLLGKAAPRARLSLLALLFVLQLVTARFVYIQVVAFPSYLASLPGRVPLGGEPHGLSSLSSGSRSQQDAAMLQKAEAAMEDLVRYSEADLDKLIKKEAELMKELRKERTDLTAAMERSEKMLSPGMSSSPSPTAAKEGGNRPDNNRDDGSGGGGDNSKDGLISHKVLDKLLARIDKLEEEQAVLKKIIQKQRDAGMGVGGGGGGRGGAALGANAGVGVGGSGRDRARALLLPAASSSGNRGVGDTVEPTGMTTGSPASAGVGGGTSTGDTSSGTVGLTPGSGAETEASSRTATRSTSTGAMGGGGGGGEAGAQVVPGAAGSRGGASSGDAPKQAGGGHLAGGDRKLRPMASASDKGPVASEKGMPGSSERVLPVAMSSSGSTSSRSERPDPSADARDREGGREGRAREREREPRGGSRDGHESGSRGEREAQGGSGGTGTREGRLARPSS
eukprot:jgi/Mesvir1/23410/Mv21102-RA.1